MRTVRAREASPNADDLRVECVDTDPPKISADQCLIEIHASGVNPSDAKALLGKFPRVVWPRTPGRDYAGVVAGGPSEAIYSSSLCATAEGLWRALVPWNNASTKAQRGFR